MEAARSVLYRLTGGDEPSAGLFRGIRWRMTLWYSGVLTAALLIFGVALYFSVSRTLMGSVDDRLAQQANNASARCFDILSRPQPRSSHSSSLFSPATTGRGDSSGLLPMVPAFRGSRTRRSLSRR